MKLDLTAKEAADVIRRRRTAARQKLDGPKLAPRPRQSVEDDGADYVAWLHHDIPCVACVILGRSAHPDIEAAHQKLQRAERGWNRSAGRRGPHWTCAPLCAGHHRIGPLCCDPAQAKFWSIVGLTIDQVIDFVEALNAAFRADEPGFVVVRRYAAIATNQRAAA